VRKARTRRERDEQESIIDGLSRSIKTAPELVRKAALDGGFRRQSHGSAQTESRARSRLDRTGRRPRVDQIRLNSLSASVPAEKRGTHSLRGFRLQRREWSGDHFNTSGSCLGSNTEDGVLLFLGIQLRSFAAIKARIFSRHNQEIQPLLFVQCHRKSPIPCRLTALPYRPFIRMLLAAPFKGRFSVRRRSTRL